MNTIIEVDLDWRKICNVNLCEKGCSVKFNDQNVK